MTKREKYPPLKPWQLAVVKKHETRNRLLNGTPYDQAKYYHMMFRRIDEAEFDSRKSQIERTFEFQRLLLGRKLFASVTSLGEAVRRIFYGR